MDVMEAIRARRAIRRFDAGQLDEDDLEAILEAGLFAPSAGGRQGVVFVVCQDRETNVRLGKIRRERSHPRMAHGDVYVSREQPSIADDPDIKDAFYGAPTVVHLFAPADFLFAPDDCACAAENMMLAATARGVGSCYIGDAQVPFDDPAARELPAQWGVPEGYRAVVTLVLGYPREGDAHPRAKARKERRVIRV